MGKKKKSCSYCGGTDDEEFEHTVDCQRPGFALGYFAVPIALPSGAPDLTELHASLISSGKPGPALCGEVPAECLVDDSPAWYEARHATCRACKAALRKIKT